MKESVIKSKLYLREIKEKTPCKDCNKNYPYYVMQFDHVRGDKQANLSKMASNSLKHVIIEIAKCEVVCANCHAIRTHERSMGRRPRETRTGREV